MAKTAAPSSSTRPVSTAPDRPRVGERDLAEAGAGPQRPSGEVDGPQHFARGQALVPLPVISCCDRHPAFADRRVSRSARPVQGDAERDHRRRRRRTGRCCPPTVATFQILNEASRAEAHWKNSGCAPSPSAAGIADSSAMVQVAPIRSPSSVYLQVAASPSWSGRPVRWCRPAVRRTARCRRPGSARPGPAPDQPGFGQADSCRRCSNPRGSPEAAVVVVPGSRPTRGTGPGRGPVRVGVWSGSGSGPGRGLSGAPDAGARG